MLQRTLSRQASQSEFATTVSPFGATCVDVLGCVTRGNPDAQPDDTWADGAGDARERGAGDSLTEGFLSEGRGTAQPWSKE